MEPAYTESAGIPRVTPPEPPYSGRRLSASLRSLRYRNYRLLWLGTLISSAGDWMDQVALNWLVYQLTGSAVHLGLLNLCRFTPILVFTLIGGVVADRVERRRLVFTTQTVAMLLAFALAALVSTGVVQFWMALAVAVGRGTMMSFNQPARQSLISDLVPTESLTNAIALNAATHNLTRIIGPAIGGGLIATVGVAGAFYFNGASFLAVLGALALMRFSEQRAVRPIAPSIARDLARGLQYLRGEPALRMLVMLALVPMVFGLPYQTMLTVFAKDVLRVGGGGLGLLMACSGVGAFLGALFIAASGVGRTRIMFIGLVAFGASLVLFSLSHWLLLSVPALIAVGMSQQVYMTSNNTLIQMNVAPEYRGRVLSTLFLNRGMVPLGTMIAAFATAAFGPQIAIGGMGAVLVLMAILAAFFTPPPSS